MNLDVGAILLGAAGVLAWGSWRIGREFPTSRRLEEVYGEGWRDARRGLADGRAADRPSTGRGAVDDDEPAPLPAPPMMCPGERRCIRGPEPHQWSYYCEEDEGWADLPGPVDGRPQAGPGQPEPTRAGESHREEGEGWTEAFDPAVGALPTADERTAMLAELAPEDDRPASPTDQFRAVFSRADGLERECLLVWDDARRFERSRPGHLLSMGISEQRIRELLGAEPA